MPAAPLRLVIVRHGTAESVREGMSDRERRLVAEGIAQAEWLASQLSQGQWRLEAILSSPWVRAQSTAEILARGVGLEVEYARALECEKPVSDAVRLTGELGPSLVEGVVGLVGHNPQLSGLVDVLTSGIAGRRGIDLRTGEAALIELSEPAAGRGVLIDRLRLGDR